MLAPTNILAPSIQKVGLNMAVTAAQTYVANTLVSVPPTIVALTISTTNYVFLNTSTGAIQVNTSGFPQPCYPIATVLTGFVGVLSLIDSRPDLYLAVASGGVVPVYVDAETPTGAINSSNTAFTLANIPNPTLSLQLYLNGVLQQQTQDYTISTLNITFAVAPQAGDILEAFYRH